MDIQHPPVRPVQLPGICRSSGAAPGSAADIAHRRAGGVPMFVGRLRYSGFFLPAHLVRPHLLFGLVVSKEEEGQRWTVSLHPEDGDTRRLLRALMHASVRKRREDGAYLLDGKEWDEAFLRQWPQTWLCAPSKQMAEHALE
ncbi:hypothetical protein, partial [Microbacterium sp. 18062]|uniref:hypothetical protein n=1 Tax=Microbacterium sp. 18062 TaxID=2681410 RepID=UPI00135B5CBE